MKNQNQEKSKPSFIKKNQENPAQGFNDWNDRLDENLEPKGQNDTVADENAKEFSEKLGSGDQSDESDK
ncbi:MAG: hypothetical protein EOO86_01695 [Pedobacter sp.]|nr:MAG: hypothetical protein EOO86_01695 [Pedobacter sp.]